MNAARLRMCRCGRRFAACAASRGGGARAEETTRRALSSGALLACISEPRGPIRIRSATPNYWVCGCAVRARMSASRAGAASEAAAGGGASGGAGAGAGAPGQRLAGVHSSVVVHPLVLLSVVDHS